MLPIFSYEERKKKFCHKVIAIVIVIAGAVSVRSSGMKTIKKAKKGKNNKKSAPAPTQPDAQPNAQLITIMVRPIREHQTGNVRSATLYHSTISIHNFVCSPKDLLW